MNKIRSIFFEIFLLFLFMGIKNFGQSFSATIGNTTLSGAIGSEIIFDFHVENISNDTITLYFLRITKNLPEGWTSSLCFERCLAPHIDSIVTNQQYGSSPIGIGEARSFSLHVFPQSSEGEANFDVKIANLNNVDEYLSFNLTATTNPTSVENEKIYNVFRLYQNYPNPFNPTTKIKYTIPIPSKSSPLAKGRSEVGFVTLKIYDVLGRELATLVNEKKQPGNYEVEFSANSLSSGVYFYKLESNNLVQVKKMIIGK